MELLAEWVRKKTRQIMHMNRLVECLVLGEEEPVVLMLRGLSDGELEDLRLLCIGSQNMIDREQENREEAAQDGS